MSCNGSNMDSREKSDSSSDDSSQISMSSDASSSHTMGVEIEVIIENMKDLTKEHVESRLPRRDGYE